MVRVSIYDVPLLFRDCRDLLDTIKIAHGVRPFESCRKKMVGHFKLPRRHGLAVQRKHSVEHRFGNHGDSLSTFSLTQVPPLRLTMHLGTRATGIVPGVVLVTV